MKEKIFFLAVLASIFSSCSTLIPIRSEYNLIRTITVNPNEYGNGKILIYNGAGIMHKSDFSASVNVWINDKALGQIGPNEFLVIYLLPGKYEFKIKHKDVFYFESKHDLIIDNETSIINIKPTATSNKIEITNELPKNFPKYKNVIQ